MDPSETPAASEPKIWARVALKRKHAADNSGPNCRLFLATEAENRPGQPLYDVLHDLDPDFLRLIMNVMPESELRRMTSVNSEWHSVANQVLRSRIGNRPMSLLWATTSKQWTQEACPISMKTHFNPSFVCGQASQERNQIYYSQNPPTFLDKIQTQKKSLADMDTILSFGSTKLDDVWLDASKENEIPDVRLFVYMIGLIVFYKTPDKLRVGDSENGLYGNMSTEPISSSLASLCLPKSDHFRIESRAVYGTSNPNMWIHTQNGLQTKVILVFKHFDDPDWSKLVQQMVNRPFDGSRSSVDVISEECLFIATNEKKIEGFTIGVMLSLQGDSDMSSIVLKFTEADLLCLDSKMSQAWGFAYYDVDVTVRKFAYFALLFSYNVPQQSTGKIDSHQEQKLLQRFHQEFPRIPIQGIGSDRPISHERFNFSEFNQVETLELVELSKHLARLQCSRGATNADHRVVSCGETILMMILMVKYPLS